MKASLLNRLVDPKTRLPLVLKASDQIEGEVLSGVLCGASGQDYRIRGGIPRFVLACDDAQRQTSDAFRFKWGKLDTYDSPAARANATRWYVEKYGFESLGAWAAYFASRESVLDVGCGSGFSSSLWLQTPEWDGKSMWMGVEISEAIDVAWQRLHHVPNTHFIQADALALPFPVSSVDTIFSEGVLHHTPSTREALLSCARVLATGGAFHFYVYRRKGAIREFTDDYVREQIAALDEETTWDVMRGLTQLARDLAELGARVEVRRDIPLLGIKAGRYDIQRLIYWNFAKLYWNPELSFEENVHINFDWYRPRYAHRQTAAQVRQWCEEACLSVEWFHEQESGYTVRAVKR